MAYGVLKDALGGDIIIADNILDENAILITDINDFLAKEDASTVQIFFSSGIPTDPVIGSGNTGEMFESYNARVFVSYNERVFRS